MTGVNVNYFNCENNKLRSVDLSFVNGARVDSIEASHNGYVGCYSTNGTTHIAAVPAAGESFNGWYDGNGQLITSSAQFSLNYNLGGSLTGGFTGPEYPAPEGYNQHDYDAIVNFLEQTDENGIKNGLKINANYDPYDASFLNTADIFTMVEVNGELRLQKIRYFGSSASSGYANRNWVGTLNLSDCVALDSLVIGYQELEAINVAQCTALEIMYCAYNQIGQIDLTGCSALRRLECQRNQLTAMDVSDCAALEQLDCTYNQLTQLDISNNPLLWKLCYNGNAPAMLDASANSDLNYIEAGNMLGLLRPNYQFSVEGNGFVHYDLHNGYGPLRAIPAEGEQFVCWRHIDSDGNEEILNDSSLYVYAEGSYAPTNGQYIACFTENGEFSYAPEGYNAHDYNAVVNFFEQTDENGIKNGFKVNANYNPFDPSTFATAQNIHILYWKNVNGEYRLGNMITFNAPIAQTYAFPRMVGSLDLSDCTAMDWLILNGQAISEINVSGCNALQTLECNDNRVTSLNISNCSVLQTLFCNKNLLTSLDISDCTDLRKLDCSQNQLSELDVSNNPVLWELNYRNNLPTSIDASGSNVLNFIYATALTCLDMPTYQAEATGNGVIKSELQSGYGNLTVMPNEGESFVTWRHVLADNTVEYINTASVRVTPTSGGHYFACFTENGEFSYAPEGYNSHDYNAVVRFLEQKDVNGVKNGSKINPNYNPFDPATFMTVNHESVFNWVTVDGEQRLEEVYLSYEIVGYANPLVGTLDLSDCTCLYEITANETQITELNASGCSSLLIINCNDNQLTKLNIDNCGQLALVYANNNMLSELDCANCGNLNTLSVYNNQFSDLDLTECPNLYSLDCTDNLITNLDISYLSDLIIFNCNGLKFLSYRGCTVEAKGNGTFTVQKWSVWSTTGIGTDKITAVPNDGESLLGWNHFEGSTVVEYLNANQTIIGLGERQSKVGFFGPLSGSYVVYFSGSDELPVQP